MNICGVELTTCGILEDGHVVRLDLVDDKGMAISLRLPFEQAQAVAMTLPSLLTRALKSLTGSPNARYVFPLDRWFVELSGQGDGLLLTMATADGFQVSFGLPAEACRGLGLTLAGGPARLAEGDADDDELVSGSVELELRRPRSSALRTTQSVVADGRSNSLPAAAICSRRPKMEQRVSQVLLPAVHEIECGP